MLQVVCENNFAENSEVGIVIAKQLPVVMRENKTRGERRPLVRLNYHAKTVEMPL